MRRKNVFVLGLDEANLANLRETPEAAECDFHPLLTIEELQLGEIDVERLLADADKVLTEFPGTVDAIVGYWDFPVSTLIPILCERYGLRSTSLDSIVRCEHKYWSRLEQRKVIDELPGFALVDVTEPPRVPEGLNFPMWLKPVKSFSSELAFEVTDEEEFAEAVGHIAEEIGRVGRPFEEILNRLDLPPEVEQAGGQSCLAEESLVGDQLAVEGYVYDKQVTVYGVLDSHTYPGSACFLRHEYPSSLPEDTVARLVDISRRAIEQMGLDNCTFSIEYFHDPKTGDLRLLEINPRHSQSHAELFAAVDGTSNHHRMVSLALGRDPGVPSRKGEYAVASKWYHRRFGPDAVVTRVPSPEEVERVHAELPGVLVEIVPESGQRLSEMPGQDSYSFELAHIVVAAQSVEEQQEKYDRCVAALRFEFDESVGSDSVEESANAR